MLQTMDLYFAVGGLFLVILGGSLWFGLNSLRRAPDDRGQKPIFQERCPVQQGERGVVLDSKAALADIALYREFLVIGFPTENPILYRELAEVSLRKGAGADESPGVYLRQHGSPSAYMLHPRDPEKLAALLESHMEQG